MKRTLLAAAIILVLSLAATLLTALPAAAQFDRGQISGTIKDAQGAVVPGVTVSVVPATMPRPLAGMNGAPISLPLSAQTRQALQAQSRR